MFVISYLIEQRRLRYRNQDFHFVTYRTLTGEAGLGDEAPAEMWFLIYDGRRYTVMPLVPDWPKRQVDRALLRWLEDNVDVVTTRSATWESVGVTFKRL